MALTKISTAMWNSVPHHLSHDFNVDDVLFVDVSDNKVGIGTVSPSSTLTVRKDGSGTINELIRLENLGAGNNEGSEISWYSNDGKTANIRSQNSTNSYGSLILDTFDNDHSTVAARINLGGTFDGISDTPFIALSTSNTERMHIDNSGKVGIGTSSPKAGIQIATNGLQGYHAWFGATGFVNNSAYHYAFAKVGFSVDDADGADTGAGFSFTTRNSGDSNWIHGYIYQPQNGGIAFGTGGAGTVSASERMRITSGGNVGIGTASPSMKMHINGDTSAMTQVGISNTSTGEARLYFDASNGDFSGNDYFSIGQQNDLNGVIDLAPAADLRILIGGTERMRIDSSGSVIVKNSTTAGANIQLQSDNGTWTQNDVISNLNTYISDTSGVGARDVAAIKVINDQVGVNTTTSGAMAFYTSPYNGSVTERMRIDSGGRVQIGSSGTPNGNLDVRTAGQSGVPSLGTAGNGINLTRTDGQTGGSIGYTTQGHIYIQSQRFDSANANDLFLQPVGGKVGIGTDSPIGKLDVFGNSTDNVGLARFTNNYASGGVYFPTASFINTRGNHSYGIVADFRTNTASDGDRPSVLFFGQATSTSWQMGQQTSTNWGGAADGFGIGYRASNDPNSFTGWPTAYFTVDTSGNTLSYSSSRAPIFYDSNDTAYYLDPNSGSVLNVLTLGGANGSSISAATGDYGTYQVQGGLGTIGGWPGWAINDDWVFMSNGPGLAGIFNDTDNKWAITFARNLETELYYNGNSEAKTQNGYFLGVNQLRAPIFYNSNDTNARLTANGLVLRGTSPTVYLRDTDQNSAMLHCNSNLFYILRGGNDTESWSAVNGAWPTYWNLTNNNMYAGATGYFTGDVVAYSSDKRLKENIKNIDSPLEKLHKINGVTFDWKDEIDELGFVPRNKKNDVGVIAQEVEKILPQVITAAPFDIKEGGDGSKSGKDYKTVQYEKLVPLLIEAVKELSEKVKMLENK